MSPGGVHHHCGHRFDVAQDKEIYLHRTAGDGSARLRDHDLESLRSLVRCPVQLGGAQEGHVVRFARILQKLGHEAQAAHQFNEVTIIFPNSIFSKAADQALEKRRRGKRDRAGESADGTATDSADHSADEI